MATPHLASQIRHFHPSLAAKVPQQLNRQLAKASKHYDDETMERPSRQATIYRRRCKDLASKAIALWPYSPDALNLLARIALDEGDAQQALSKIELALGVEPNNAGYWYSKGHILLARGALEDALSAFETSRTLNPEAFRTQASYAYTLLQQGMVVDALQLYRQLARINPEDPHVRAKLFECLRQIKADYYIDDLAEDLCTYLDWQDVNHNDLAQPIASLLIHKYQLTQGEDVIDVMRATTDRLLLLALQKLYFTDPALEALIAALRRYLLLECAAWGCIPNDLRPLVIALAFNSHNNEYVIGASTEERQLVDLLLDHICTAQAEQDFRTQALEEPMLLYAMYSPLSRTSCAEKLAALDSASWAPYAQPALKALLREPFNARHNSHSAEQLGEISDPVTQAVRDQYEEHPYPRWLALDYHTPTEYKRALQNALPGFPTPEGVQQKPLHILVAGCGTGRHALHVARYFRNVEVLAVDISTQSLNYAAQMAKRYGIGNIRFLQADILELPQLKQRFHVIECSGVLHHMDNPLAGWRALKTLLKPQGLMKIGLYSRRAREEVLRCREIIAQDDIGSDAEGIRHFRQRLLSGDLQGRFPKVVQSPDLYNLSGCRDLLFHVQEHCFTPLQIADACDSLDLEFLGFIRTPGDTKSRYKQRFSKDLRQNDLANWELFEIDNPDTFAAMYQFYVQSND